MLHLRCFYWIFVQSFRELLFSKKTLLFLLGSLAYAGLIAIVILKAGDRRAPDELFCGITLGYFFQVALPLTSMFFAVSALRDEISNRTLVYLIAGPVPRSSIWLGKYAAALAVSWVLLGLGYFAARSIAPYLGDAGWRSTLSASVAASTLAAPLLPLLLGPAAYVALGNFFAIFFKRPMLAGAIYIVGWEYVVGSTPAQAGARSLTIIDSLRTLFYNGLDEAVVPQFRAGMRGWVSGGDQRFEDFVMPSNVDALCNLAWLAGIALLLSLWVGARRDFDMAASDA